MDETEGALDDDFIMFSSVMDLHEAAEAGNLERVQMLVEQGADKDKTCRFRNNKTPLCVASCEGHIDVVRYLVEQGADMEKANKQGWTPLIDASSNDQYEVVRYLLEQGANRDKATKNRWTSFHYAVAHGYLETAKLLMVYGADLNARTSLGQLPINIARTKAIKQAIRDEPRRRMDEAPGKRATEQDRHPNAVASASEEQGEEEEHQNNKKLRLDETAEVEDDKVAEEDEPSEPSDDEDDRDV